MKHLGGRSSRSLLWHCASALASSFIILLCSGGSLSSQAASCFATPSGLVSWWAAEASTSDNTGTNPGTLQGGATYGQGEVGGAFVFNGLSDAVAVPNSPSLDLQDFTIEGWIKRANSSYATQDAAGAGGGCLFAGGIGAYGYVLMDDGRFLLTRIGYDGIFSQTLKIKDTAYHHVAITKSGTAVVFYLDGVAETASAYSSVFTFTTSWAIGSRGGDYVGSFWGSIDELSVYHRALTGSEIQGIVGANGMGKCGPVVAPIILSSFGNRTTYAGAQVTLSVVAAGTPPISYQWTHNSTVLSGVTGPTLNFPSVQSSDGGTYQVHISNASGAADTTPAVLTVATTCLPAPANLISFWRGEGDAQDYTGANDGTFVGNASTVPGMVGQGFVFDGSGDAVSIPDSATLHEQDFTIEGWIKRSSTALASRDNNGFGTGCLFGGGVGAYGFVLSDSGKLLLTKIGTDNVSSRALTITDTAFHHVAVTKTGSTVVFYVDGVGETAPAYGSTFSFGTSWAIGARGGDFAGSFLGAIDELTLYGRALSSDEVATIAGVGPLGKCLQPFAPFIKSSFPDTTVYSGTYLTLTVNVAGSAPLTYQWTHGSTLLPSVTGPTLTISSVQSSDAGTYQVHVSNSVGSADTLPATLIVNPAPPCQTPPTGLISWWRGDGNTQDQTGNNPGTLAGNTTIVPAYIGNGFSFDGAGDGVAVANSPSLQLQNFTIEGWIKRADASHASQDPAGAGCVFCGGIGAYGLAVLNNGTLLLTKVGYDGIYSQTLKVTDTSFHHVAVTKNGTTVVFYLDGVAETAPAYSSIFAFAQNFAIGARGGDYAVSFLGTIDEVTIYNRALSGAEVTSIYNAVSGKCPIIFPPTIWTQPLDQTVTLGGTAVFTVFSGGTAPLTYQWYFKNAPIQGETGSSLTLHNVTFAQAGAYSVTVSNGQSSQPSSSAVLTVVYPPATLQAGTGLGPSSGTVTIPVTLQANGNENALSFSVSFPTQFVQLVSVQPGANLSGATLLVNNSQTANGAVGVAISLGANSTFPAGNLELVQLQFKLGISPITTTASLAFTDQPTLRKLSDAQAQSQPLSFQSGQITIGAAEFAGDVEPAPNGDEAVTITDWVLIGRFVARLDQPSSPDQFLRADCAPRLTGGDGALTVSDWVQAGRYLIGADPLTVVTPLVGSGSLVAVDSSGSNGRTLKVGSAPLGRNQTCTVPVKLTALGQENAVSFSISFDPTVLTYVSSAVGSAASGGTLDINSGQAAAGQVGYVVALPPGTSLTAGTWDLVDLHFQLANGAHTGKVPITLTDQPVPRGVADVTANPASADYLDGFVDTIVPQTQPYIFYNNSFWDGNDASANTKDTQAIATDKTPLWPGHKATFANYTSYRKGINGIIIDMPTLPGAPASLSVTDDFIFKVGNNSTPDSWPAVSPLPSVQIRAGGGVSGTDRVTLIWPDNTIKRQWLQVTVLSTAHTGLASPEVFYFGNAIGETGDSSTTAEVLGNDALRVLNHLSLNVGVTNIYDIDRDGNVLGNDVLVVLNNLAAGASALQLIDLTGFTPFSVSEASLPAATESTVGLSTRGVPNAAPIGGMGNEFPGFLAATFRQDGGLALQCPAKDGLTYRLQSSESLSSGVWTDVDQVPESMANGRYAWAIPADKTAAQRFYRVLLITNSGEEPYR